MRDLFVSALAINKGLGEPECTGSADHLVTRTALVKIRLSSIIRYILSHNIRFPTMWYVWQVKSQISLRIWPVLSEPLLAACIKAYYEP